MFAGVKYWLRCLWLEIGFHWLFRRTSETLATLAARIVRPFAPSRSLWLLTVAHRLAMKGWGETRSPATEERHRRLVGQIARLLEEPGAMAAWPRHPTPEDVERANGAALVVKAPCFKDGSIEKGVILLKYSHRIEAFHRAVNMDALLEQYRLVLEPSWSGYADLRFLSFTRYREHPVVMLAPFPGDREFIQAIGQNLTAVELGPGDWVDPSVFRPLPGEPKRYDAVLIARWNHVKRHDRLLRVLRELGDPTFRVALLAAHTTVDTEREEILRMIETSGLRGQIEVFENLPAAEVNRVLNQGKVNLLLSSQEGGNRGIYEGFFAGVPALVPRGHIGIRTEYIVPETGRLFDVAALAGELQWFRDHWEEYEPRRWALEHIAPEVSAARLNDVLRQLALRQGEPWTVDIVAKTNQPGQRYYPNAEAGRELPSAESIVRQYPRTR
jgi:glycosyltransferase involved in cell wall biosynthesis